MGGSEISYEAAPAVRAALERIGGSEDVRFSPSNRRLALACLPRHSIVIADVTVALTDLGPKITITHVAEFSSPGLDRPHGVDFVDDDTVAVANRGGNVALLRLPSDIDAAEPGARRELAELELPPGGTFDALSLPGSVRVLRDPGAPVQVLVANSWNSTITRHVLQDEPMSVTTSDVLLHRWLESPDGLALSPDDQWIAVSNHDAHVVLLYRRSSSLDENADPVCVLRGATYPHGTQFTADSRHLLVADAARPYVHVYTRDGLSWEGVLLPAASFRVMDDTVFAKARDNQSGGPKGVDIDREGRVLAVACENQSVTFYDVATMLELAASQPPDPALQLEAELRAMEHAHDKVEARIAKIVDSRSFRVTKPLRQINAAWAKRRG